MIVIKNSWEDETEWKKYYTSLSETTKQETQDK